MLPLIQMKVIFSSIKLKIFIVFFTLIITSLHGTSQSFESYDTPAPKFDWKERVFFGGNLGAQFGTHTFINVAPLVGFKVTERFSIGTQLQYQYFRYNIGRVIQSHVFGYSGFTRYSFTDNLFGYAEYQALNGYFDYSGKRTNIPHFFIGGGYQYPISDNVSFNIMALYEVIQRTYSPYVNPIIRAGVNVGL